MLDNGCATRIDPFGVAQTGPVKRRDAIAVGQLVDQRECEIPQVAAGSVDQDDVRAGALGDIMHLRAIDVQECALWGKPLFGTGFAVVCRAGCGQHQRSCTAKQDA